MIPIQEACETVRDNHGRPCVDTCHIGLDAMARLAEYVRGHCGSHVLAIMDANTRQAAGEAVLEALDAAGVRFREHTFGAEPLDATDILAREVTQLAEGRDAVVAVGSGTLCDLAKAAGQAIQRPAVLFATAASMNGYTSGIVALRTDGLKTTAPCPPAKAVFACPDILAAAPPRMTAAGVGDYLSKCCSSPDWRVANVLRGEHFNPDALHYYEGILDRVLAQTDRIGKGEPKAIALLFEALLLSGLSMLAAGSSAPASGGEHLISHYLDMKSAALGTPHDLHGCQVGVAAVYCLTLWERIIEMEAADIEPAELASRHPTLEEARACIKADWGPLAPTVLTQWEQKARNQKSVEDELVLFRQVLPVLRETLSADIRPSVTVAAAIHEAGGPTFGSQLTVPLEQYLAATKLARYIRNRFTVLDLAAELGME